VEQKRELKNLKPGWASVKEGSPPSPQGGEEADDGYVETGLEKDTSTNYENQLVGNPKALTNFEVKKTGKLGYSFFCLVSPKHSLLCICPYWFRIRPTFTVNIYPLNGSSLKGDHMDTLKDPNLC
jgi:hypothetical protein